MYYKDINSLEELDASKLPIIFASLGVSDLFGSKNDTDSTPLIQSLRRKLQQGYNSLNTAAYYRNITGLMRKHHFAIMSEELVDTNGAPLLHLIEECPGTKPNLFFNSAFDLNIPSNVHFDTPKSAQTSLLILFHLPTSPRDSL